MSDLSEKHPCHAWREFCDPRAEPQRNCGDGQRGESASTASQLVGGHTFGTISARFSGLGDLVLLPGKGTGLRQRLMVPAQIPVVILI